MRLSEVLKEGRKYPSGKTQQQVADEMGVHVNTLVRHEKMKAKYWRRDRWAAYLDLTGLTEDDYEQNIAA